MPPPAGSSDTSGLGTQPAPGSFFVRGATRKSRQGFPRRLVPLRCVCVEVRRVERCSNVAKPASHWTHTTAGALPICRANDPDSVNLSPATMFFKPALLTYR